MPGLVLKLAPNERVLINGVVMENGERKATLRIKTPNASILRLRDALHPDDANTPVTRAYYAAQLVVSGSADAEEAAPKLRNQLEALAKAFDPIKEREVVEASLELLRQRNFYALMRKLHPLIAVEKKLLGLTHPAAAAASVAAESAAVARPAE